MKGQVNYWFYENPVSKVHHVLNAGDGFFINSKTLHEYRQIVPGTEVFIFSVSAGFFASSPAFETIYQDLVLPVLRSGIPGLFLLESSNQNAYLLKLFRQFQAKRMSRILDYIHQHYSEQIMVEQIARTGKIRKRECFRCFQAFLSQAPGEYLNQYRLSRICEQCGFNNVSYFGKLFRRQYGIPPERFRFQRAE